MTEKVGYLGPGKVTFGYMAAEKCFQEQAVEFVPFLSHNEVCDAVTQDLTDYGVVAAENVIEGPVTETIYAIEKFHREFGLRICGEVEIPIELFLLRKINNESLPKKLASHAIGIRQCERVVRELQSKGVTVEVVESTGRAAQIASENSDYAALASVKAEEEFGLARLRPESVADNRNNFTRFWVVGMRNLQWLGSKKTCFLVNLDQKTPGVLCKTLEPFAKRRINLLIITPLPIPGRKWEYTFMLEFAGHIRDHEMNEAYEELRNSGTCVGAPLVLGSYPATQD